VERYAHTEFASDQWYVVERWLAMLPIEIRHERPLLLLAEAWVRNLQHQLARVPPLIDEAQALLSTAGSTDSAVRMAKGMIGLLRGYLAYYEGLGSRSLQYLEEAMASLAQTESSFFADTQMFLALARCMVGQRVHAAATLQASADAADPSQAYLLSRLLGGLTFLHLLGVELHAAHTQAQRLACLASANDMRLNLAWSGHLLGCTLLHTGEREEASDHFEQAVEMRYLLEPMAAVDAMAGLALARQLLGLDDAAATACGQLQGFAQELNEAGGFAVAQSCRARIDLLRGETASARRWALSIDAEPAPHNLFFWLEFPQLTAARILPHRRGRHIGLGLVPSPRRPVDRYGNRRRRSPANDNVGAICRSSGVEWTDRHPVRLAPSHYPDRADRGRYIDQRRSTCYPSGLVSSNAQPTHERIDR